jgi:DHA2 family multidrug resistance protein
MQRAYALVGTQLSTQARLWSYVDDFRYLALVCFGCIPIVFLLKKSVKRAGAQPVGH